MIAFVGSVISEKGWDLVWMPITHFILSGLVGLLVFWLILTILSTGRFGTYLKEKQFCKEGFSIYRFSFVVALCFSVAIHILEDIFLDIF